MKAANQTLTMVTDERSDSWKLMPIKDVADINPKLDKSALPDKLMVSFVPMRAVGAGDGTIDVSDLRPAAEVKKGFTNFRAGDVLFAKITPCMENGKMAVVPKVASGYGFGSTEFHVLRSKNGLDPRYLYYFVSSQSVRKEAAHNMTGAVGQKRVATSYIANLEIPLAPPDQQRLIVAEIEKQFSRLDEAVANLNRVKANLKRYKAAVLKAAVEGRLVETETELARREGRSYETGAQLLKRVFDTRRSQWKGKGKYMDPAWPDTIDLPALPEGWVWATAEQLAEFITKGTTPAATKLSEGVGEIQFLKVYNLTFDGSLNYSYKTAFISRKTHEGELARSKVLAGDVLINIVGPPLGQVSVVPPVLVEANINQAIARFRPVPPLGSKFLSLTLLADEIMRWAIRRAKTTVGQANLTLELCRALPIPLPPLNEQNRIAAEVDRRFSLVRGVAAQVDANLLRAERLRQTILKAAFTGKV